MTRLVVGSLAVLVILLVPLPTSSATPTVTPTYHVEVIVFRNAGSREELGGAPPLRGAGEPDSPTGGPLVARYVGPLPASAWQLAGARERLTKAGYRVLAHAAWIQTPSSWGSRIGLPLDALGIRVPGLSGQFLLERGSLLHLGMNLRFVAEGAGVSELSEIRRIRFNERQYFDHPGLGVIGLVSPGSR